MENEMVVSDRTKTNLKRIATLPFLEICEGIVSLKVAGTALCGKAWLWCAVAAMLEASCPPEGPPQPIQTHLVDPKEPGHV